VIVTSASGFCEPAESLEELPVAAADRVELAAVLLPRSIPVKLIAIADLLLLVCLGESPGDPDEVRTFDDTFDYTRGAEVLDLYASARSTVSHRATRRPDLYGATG
jgi:hypothetical protein